MSSRFFLADVPWQFGLDSVSPAKKKDKHHPLDFRRAAICLVLGGHVHHRDSGLIDPHLVIFDDCQTSIGHVRAADNPPCSQCYIPHSCNSEPGSH
jgi:hypothetical protein